MPLGIYISVPFCRTKCTFCNFASEVFSKAKYGEYVERVCADIARAEAIATEHDGTFERAADSIYLGGGTPSVLAPEQLRKIFAAVRQTFDVDPGAEVTVECAPGTISDELIATLLACGVNRVSLGVQSFVDKESSSVGRLHTREVVLADLARLRAAGIAEISVDLIVGLPHQTAESWELSLNQAIATGVPHVSVYILEVDDESRLGRELMAGGQRYHAHHVPNDDLTAELYERAGARLHAAGAEQYEISNFARTGHQSRHNLKYWTRQPYLGFGLDASSMLRACADHAKAGMDAVRFSTPATLEAFLGAPDPCVEYISQTSALEETFFLGLRMNRGVSLKDVEARFGKEAAKWIEPDMLDVLEAKLAYLQNGTLKLTPRGRLLSNEVFEKFVAIGTERDLREMLGLDPDQPLPGIAISHKIH